MQCTLHSVHEGQEKHKSLLEAQIVNKETKETSLKISVSMVLTNIKSRGEHYKFFKGYGSSNCAQLENTTYFKTWPIFKIPICSALISTTYKKKQTVTAGYLPLAHRQWRCHLCETRWKSFFSNDQVTSPSHRHGWPALLQ